MKGFNKIIFLLLIVSVPLIFMHCTKYKEEAPFFDGLFLEYDAKGAPIIYEVQAIENNKFKIIETEKWKVLGDNVEEIYVDKYGRVYKSKEIKSWGEKVKESKDSFNPIRWLISAFFGRGEGTKDNEKVFSPIWIPVHKMEIGDSFDEFFFVIKKDKWEKWDVLVIKDSIVGAERYHDLNTGFLVGSLTKTPIGTVKIVLMDTNADIPTEG